MWQAGVFCLWEGSTQGILLVSSASLSPNPVICLKQLQSYCLLKHWFWHTAQWNHHHQVHL
jgi:hypothetical protein